MLNQSNFDSSLLKRHIQDHMPLSYNPNQTVREQENEFTVINTTDRRTNAVLPKIFPDVFSLSYYNTNGRTKNKNRNSNNNPFSGIDNPSNIPSEILNDESLKLTSQRNHSLEPHDNPGRISRMDSKDRNLNKTNTDNFLEKLEKYKVGPRKTFVKNKRRTFLNMKEEIEEESRPFTNYPSEKHSNNIKLHDMITMVA